MLRLRPHPGTRKRRPHAVRLFRSRPCADRHLARDRRTALWPAPVGAACRTAEQLKVIEFEFEIEFHQAFAQPGSLSLGQLHLVGKALFFFIETHVWHKLLVHLGEYCRSVDNQLSLP